MTRTDFAVFILSNGRPDQQLTLETLEKSGYTGDWFILCDSLDPTLKTYRQKYGENVLVFDKEAYAEQMDTMTNQIELGTVLYARQASIDLARQRGYRYFMQIDDDMTAFSIRYEDEGKLKGAKVTDLDRLVQSFVEFMKRGDVAVTGFGNSGGYIGGLHGKFAKGYTRSVAGVYIIDSSKDIEFKGIINEDYNLSAEYSKVGHLIFEILAIAFTTSQRGANAGGLQDLYNAEGTYTMNAYSIVIAPHCTRLILRNDKVVTRTNWNNHHPLIISEKYKKGG